MKSHEFPLSGPLLLNVRNDVGSITVTTADDLDTASVVVESDELADDELDRVVVELRGSTLSVVTPHPDSLLAGTGNPFGTVPRIDVRATVPTATAVRLLTGWGPITCRGHLGATEVASGSGQVSVESVEGDLDARCGSGSLEADTVTGTVHLRASSGGSRFGEIGGELDATTGSGSFSARRVSGRVMSKSGSGSARFDDVRADVQHSSGSGRLELGLPVGTDVQLDIRTGSGRVQSELPIDDAPGGAASSIRIRVRTGSGDVRLFRAQ